MQLRVRDVSRLLRVPEKTVHNWIERGILRASQINDQYRLHRADLLECITSQNMDAPAGMFAGTGGNRQTISLTTSLRAGGIHYGISGADKQSVLANAVARLPLSNQRDRELYLHLLLAREALGTSAIGDGIAIPHVRRPAIFRLAKPLVTLCFLERPIDFHASDARPVGVLFFSDESDRAIPPGPAFTPRLRSLRPRTQGGDNSSGGAGGNSRPGAACRRRTGCAIRRQGTNLTCSHCRWP